MDHCTCESQKAVNLLKTARGQVDAILGMVEDDRYCVDISRQIISVLGILRKANLTILRQHMDTCVRSAIGGDDREKKLQEVMMILESYIW